MDILQNYGICKPMGFCQIMESDLSILVLSVLAVEIEAELEALEVPREVAAA